DALDDRRGTCGRLTLDDASGGHDDLRVDDRIGGAEDVGEQGTREGQHHPLGVSHPAQPRGSCSIWMCGARSLYAGFSAAGPSTTTSKSGPSRSRRSAANARTLSVVGNAQIRTSRASLL